jgi:AcrR family transcriptional regulator
VSYPSFFVHYTIIKFLYFVSERTIFLPTQTFFNLPEEKRERIIDAAILEFASCSVSQARIARIIEKAGIPRGSFYQYFENLKDLYKYIFDLAGEKKINYYHSKVPDLQGTGFNFFQTFRKLFVVGFQFARDNPLLLAFGNNFLKETNPTLRAEILGEQHVKAENIYAEMIRRGIALKQLDPNIDPIVAAHFINALTNSLGEFYLNEVSLDFNEQKLLTLADKMLDFLANGLKNRTV